MGVSNVLLQMLREGHSQPDPVSLRYGLGEAPTHASLQKLQQTFPNCYIQPCSIQSRLHWEYGKPSYLLHLQVMQQSDARLPRSPLLSTRSIGLRVNV
jgi:hypothetical protein